MPNHKLKQILLESWGDEAPPLFPSQREIARRVAALPNSRYHGKEKTLGVFINQIFRGERPCPSELVDPLLQAAKNAVAARGGARPTPREVQEKLLLLLKSQGAGADPVERLLARQVGAQEVVIVNPETQEGRQHPLLEKFQEAMLRTVLESEGRYTFILDKKHLAAAQRFWKATKRGLKAALGDKNDREAGAKAKELDEEGRIAVFVIESSHCIVPVVAFDPQKRPYCEIYVWDWEPNEAGEPQNNIARLSSWIKDKWIDDFYEPLLLNPSDQMDRMRYHDDSGVDP